jgi:hypothetical protein
MKSARKPTPRYRTVDARRQRIVDAARVHFFSLGFQSVTMEELDVIKKTLYAHFRKAFRRRATDGNGAQTSFSQTDDRDSARCGSGNCESAKLEELGLTPKLPSRPS